MIGLLGLILAIVGGVMALVCWHESQEHGWTLADSDPFWWGCLMVAFGLYLITRT